MRHVVALILTAAATLALAQPAHTADAPVSVASAVRVVHGDTHASIYWRAQGPADCAPMAARVLVGELTGRVVGHADIDATAARLADYDADGTAFEKLPAVLAAYGVSSRAVTGAGLDELRATLDAVGPAILLVNAETVWALDPALDETPGDEPDHALVLERIDDATHTATLVDSGSDAAVSVPVPTLLSAWSASGNAAVLPDAH